MTELIIILPAFIVFFFIFLRELSFDCIAENSIKITPTYTVLIAKNNEDSIEGVIHSLIMNMQSKSNNLIYSDILVVDLGSTDATLKILEKLSARYEFIHILHSTSCINMMAI